MLAWSPDSPTSPAQISGRPRRRRLGKARRAELGSQRKQEESCSKPRLPPAPSLLISPSISHTYIYFFSNSPPPPRRTTIIGLLHMRITCRGWVCIFRPFAQKLPEFSAPPTIIPHPHPKESHLYIMLYYFSRLARRGREQK